MLKIYNTLTKTKDEFKPQSSNEVKMYTCGVTVYDDCHIGHGRSLYVFEVMRRYLTYRGYCVRLVRNITDVDDKIINKAREWSKRESISLIDAFDKVRTTYINSYYSDLERLRIPRADFEPLATENIPDMQRCIEFLIDKGFAYEKEDGVYFSPKRFNEKYSSYGLLSGNTIEKMLSEEGDFAKEDALDFALWKKAKIDEPYWDSPWGRGRPGWHIECSVMSQKYLEAETLDIHGGGRDLVFPHHENECAQSQAYTGKTFAKYWIHHGLLTIEKQKMAKSLGNFITIKAVLDKYPVDVLKLFYLGAHYSSSIDFSWKQMDESKKAYERIDNLKKKLDAEYASFRAEDRISWGTTRSNNFAQQFIEAMDDDFNMPKGLAVLFEMVNKCYVMLESDDTYKNGKLAYALHVIDKIIATFGITFEHKADEVVSDEEIELKVTLRNNFRRQRRYAEADKLRKELEEKGIIIEDKKDGTAQWRRKL